MLIGKKRKDSLLYGVEEIERIFKYLKNKVNENSLSQRTRHRFPRHEAIDQLGNVFINDLETKNDQVFAETYAAGLYDVNYLQDRWDKDLTVQETETEEKM